MSEPNEERLLLDPSVFLGEEGWGWLEEVPHDERGQFVVSQTFFDQVARRSDYTSADEELWGPLPDGKARGQLEELIAGLAMFSEADASSDLPHEVVEVADRLRTLGSQVAVEEWLYLQSHSWMGARKEKIVEHFKKARAKVAKVSGNVVSDLTWLAAKQRPPRPPGKLTRKVVQRAAMNVVVVGGVASVGAFMPWLAVPGALIALVIDPVINPPPEPG